MTSLSRFSEPYPPTGGIASEGVRNLLGRPTLEPLELLVRESIQNSWDAKREDSDQVRVSISLKKLDDGSCATMRERVLSDPPDRLPLAGALAASNPQLLVIADRGTIGLKGALRSDQIVESAASDFVDFIRDIGQPPDRHLGAGSFGYGKGAFYLLSRASTIIVHTRCATPAGVETRLIACGLGEHFTDGEGVRLTGRHWWGSIADDGIVDPLLGEEADVLAAAIGLPPFDGDETGTTIAIVAPRLVVAAEDSEVAGEVDRHTADRQALRFVGEAIAWNFWPKMVSLGGTPPAMRFQLDHDGEPMSVPDPDADPRLRVFASAFRALKGEEPIDPGLGGETIAAWCQRPRRRLGTVSIRRDAILPTAPAPGSVGVGERLHHIALMRRANLVVRYVAGPPLASDRAGYAGVFECEQDLDQVFRRSEPPTHDRWEPQFLENPDRRFVNVALTRVREIAERFAAPATAPAGASADLAVGEFSSQLADLIPALPGPGAAFGARGGRTPRSSTARGATPDGGGPAPRDVDADGGVTRPIARPGGGSQPSSRREPRIEVVESARPVLVGDRPVVEVSFRIEPGAEGATRVSASSTVLTLDGGAIERDPPEGAPTPQLLCWVSADGGLDTATELEVGEGDDSVWIARFSHQPDALVRIDLSAEAA